MRMLLLLGLVACVACEEPQKAEAREKRQAATAMLADGRVALAKGQHDRASALFKKAISLQPDDVSLYLNLAEAYRATGNLTGAILTLKQAEQIGGDDPAIKRLRADLFLEMHDKKAAIGELVVLRDQELLTDPELLQLTRLQAQTGKVEAAFKTLEKIQSRSPDDLEAKVVEAEVLLVKGDEELATKLMDRLLEEHPGLASAHLLRARYAFTNDQAAQALEDLNMLAGDDAKTGPAVSLRAKVLNAVDRHADAATLLQQALSAHPDDPELMALLAETRLWEGKSAEALQLVDRVLVAEPKWARALYVRGRAQEEQSNSDQAALDYQAALKSDPNLVPALSRLWRIYEARQQQADAIQVLERLFFLNELRPEEEVALARQYSETLGNPERGLKLIEEALRRDPKNPEYLKLKRKLKGGSGSGKSGVIIMKR